MLARALLIDDDVDFATELQESLSYLGIPTLALSSPQHFLQALRDHPSIDFIVLDLLMPNLDGLELLRKIKALPGREQINVVVVTGAATLDRALEAFRRGAIDLLQKPVEAHEIAKIIRRFDHEKSMSKRPGVSPVRLIEFVSHSRKVRDKIFPAHMFEDPVWDMILELARNGRNSSGIAVSSLCLSTKTSTTTALRRIALMHKEGLIERSADHDDARRVFISLTEKGWNQVEAFVERLSEYTVIRGEPN